MVGGWRDSRCTCAAAVATARRGERSRRRPLVTLNPPIATARPRRPPPQVAEQRAAAVHDAAAAAAAIARVDAAEAGEADVAARGAAAASWPALALGPEKAVEVTNKWFTRECAEGKTSDYPLCRPPNFTCELWAGWAEIYAMDVFANDAYARYLHAIE